MHYELIDHTADIGIHVVGIDIKDLFTTAAQAMFEQITDTKRLQGGRHQRLDVSGIDQPDLLINWLRELLSFWTIKSCLVKRVVIREIDEDRLSADVFYDEYDPKQHDIHTDIKAVTYHGASVDRTETGCEATIIFDV